MYYIFAFRALRAVSAAGFFFFCEGEGTGGAWKSSPQVPPTFLLYIEKGVVPFLGFEEFKSVFAKIDQSVPPHP